jgi:imidazolonepropionase-like amidohydrolase
MQLVRILPCCLLFAVACSTAPANQEPTRTNVFFFEGARLITGVGGAPIERSAFIVADGRFAEVSRAGELQRPAGAIAVDLTDKTVMPGIVEVHAHLGYWNGPQNTNVVGNFTRENILDHLQRFAYHGVAVVLSLGTDRRELAYDVRDEFLRAPPPDAAAYLTAGQGLSLPGAGPGFPMRPAVYEVKTEDEARRAVQELAARRVDRAIKLWHDAARGTLPPPVYQAVIDEAHKHNLLVLSHVDQTGYKDLLRAGLDGFAHSLWRGPGEVDDELIALLKERPNVFTLSTLWASRNEIYGPRPYWLDDPLLDETLTRDEIRKLENPKTSPDAPQRWVEGIVPRNLAKIKAAGVRIGLGGDIGGLSGGGGYFGWSSQVEMESLVRTGLTPSEAILVVTRNSAEILGLDDFGTIAPGKSANFIVLDANPLENIANTRRIAAVYLRGKPVDRAALRAKWAGNSSN